MAKNKYEKKKKKKFGRLTVIGISDKNTRKTYWDCLCECGNMKSVRADSLKAGLIRSCGCLKKEQDKNNLVNDQKKKAIAFGSVYGHTRLHDIWSNMKGRCYNHNDSRYSNYGGRGITVCDEWKDDYFSFYKWAIENGYSDNLTIDRIDNDKGYDPENCRWTDLKTQARNRTSNINITIGNSTRTLTEWCEIFEIPFKTVNGRYKSNGFTTVDELFRSQHRGNYKSNSTVERRK